MVENDQTVQIKIPYSKKRNILSIHFKNKTSKDTVVENNIILKDKSVVINEILFDNVRVRHDDLYQQGFMEVNKVRTKSAGLYLANSVYKFYFENPVIPFFLKSKKGYFSKQVDENKQSINQLVDFFTKLTSH